MAVTYSIVYLVVCSPLFFFHVMLLLSNIIRVWKGTVRYHFLPLQARLECYYCRTPLVGGYGYGYGCGSELVASIF